MSLAMTPEERQAFLAELHVGVVALAREDRAPLAVPIWYGYEPGDEVGFVTAPDSVKGRLLADSGRASLCAQTEQAPYSYVTVEGPVTDSGPANDEERQFLAHRYLGRELGDLYLEATKDHPGNTYRLRPEQWYSVDYRKEFG